MRAVGAARRALSRTRVNEIGRRSKSPVPAAASGKARIHRETPISPNAGPSTVVNLQRTAGNEAVEHLLLTAQRYEAYEHATEGDKVPGSTKVEVGQDRLAGGARIGTVLLTSGEINALADLYGSPEELFDANPIEVAKVVNLVRKQKDDPKSVKESDWDDATGGNYTRLNLANRGHFGPHNPDLINPAGGSASLDDNRHQFLGLYSKTLVYAQKAFTQIGVPDPAYREAWLDRSAIAAGFAEHYIMDAFSAGHLFNKDDFVAVAEGNLQRLSKEQLSQLFDVVVDGVLANSTLKALLYGYQPAPHKWGPEWFKFPIGGPQFSWPPAFKGLLEQLYEDPEGRQAFDSALVRVAHDYLGRVEVEKGQLGVPVVNDRRDPWVLSGDWHLESSPDTQAQIDAAIAQFRTNIEPFRHGLVPGQGAAPGADLVLAYFPRPTADSARMISQLVQFVTDPQKGMALALVTILGQQMPAFLHGLERRGDIRTFKGPF